MSDAPKSTRVARPATILDARGGFLRGAERNDYSQYGEDGLIEACLGRFGEGARWCFEVGAADGVYFSNTLRLRELGWNAVLIEKDDQHFVTLQEWGSDRVFCVHEEIREEATIDRVLRAFVDPTVVQLGVIDIDGQDYWAWHDMVSRPTIMVVECVPGDGGPVIPERGREGRQATQVSLVELGEEKGYVALARTHVNVIFVVREAI